MTGGTSSGRADGWTPERSVAGNHNPWAIVAVISIATFMTVLDTSIVNVALDHIAGDLSASYDQATWVTTTFLAATAIVIPISGWLADVMGRKRYYMTSVALFTLVRHRAQSHCAYLGARDTRRGGRRSGGCRTIDAR